MIGILITALVFSVGYAVAYRIALKAVGIYYRKKGYTYPTDEELKECSREALKQTFGLNRK